MLQNNITNKKQTLKNFDDSMKLLLTESVKFFPVSSINRIRRKHYDKSRKNSKNTRRRN